MSDDPRQLSLKLCEVLERLGVSASMREIYRDTSICREMIDTISMNMTDLNISMHIFGSTCEGTKTPDMGSDLDMVLCVEDVPVIEDLRDAPPGQSLLMVTCKHTKPGHVKLQVVQDGIALTRENHFFDCTDRRYDCEGKVCLKHYISKDPDFGETNGPAQTMSNRPDVEPTDQVAAYRCRKFAQNADESLEKCIASGLMSRDDVERMKSLGVLVVGIGHESSEERDIEWRISFSHQERSLMLALNPTQHKCYVTLKLIKNLIPTYGDEKKPITSYHCKTCLLTVITSTSVEQWTDENLIQCTFMCLSELINWVTQRCCPNFFIKESNMFERQQFAQVRDRLLVDLQEMQKEETSLFYRINSDCIGEALQGRAGREIDQSRSIQMYSVLINACGMIWQCQMDILDYCHKSQCSQDVRQFLSQKLNFLESVDTIYEYTQEQTKMALQKMEPVIHKLFAQHLASEAFSTEDPVARHRMLETRDYHLRLGMNSDAMSCRLLEATILYREGHLESCCGLLKQIMQNVIYGAIVSTCRCRFQVHEGNTSLMRKITSGDINQHNIMSSSVALCMMFIPSQTELIPKAFQYEMFRSVGELPGSRREEYEKWFDWAVVDSTVYLYFLQYLVYSDLKQPAVKRFRAMDEIEQSLIQDKNLRHTDTALNLLGWMYAEEGQFEKAVDCLCRSLQIRPDHNAAKWHLAILFYRLSLQQ